MRYSVMAIMVVVGGAFIAFCFSAIQLWHVDYGWHDQQRIFQLSLMVVVALFSILLPRPALPALVILMLAGIFILGFFSSYFSAFTGWAYKEWARYCGLTVLAVFVASLAEKKGVVGFLIFMMCFVGLIHVVQFVSAYLAAIVSVRNFDPHVMFSGFSNPRFFSQFQVMLFPVLSALIVFCWQNQLKRVGCFLMSILAVQWCIGFALGGRGGLLGVLASHVVVVLINWRFWRLTAYQVTAASIGLCLYLISFFIIPFALGQDWAPHHVIRTSLSGRDLIWQWAYEMALSSPWLGIGPMHYAVVINPIAAHPHQVILQWLSEWGGMATGLALALGIWGIVRGAGFLRHSSTSGLDSGVWAAIIGALVLAQVDGVFVMPYCETWLVVLIGIALGRYLQVFPELLCQKIFFILISISAVLVLGQTLLKEVPGLPQEEAKFIHESRAGWKPRFWEQGWIPSTASECGGIKNCLHNKNL